MGNSIFSFWDWKAVSQYVRQSQSSWVNLFLVSGKGGAGRLSISMLGGQSSWVILSFLSWIGRLSVSMLGGHSHLG